MTKCQSVLLFGIQASEDFLRDGIMNIDYQKAGPETQVGYCSIGQVAADATAWYAAKSLHSGAGKPL